MAKPKEKLDALSINQLQTLTGHSYRTLKKKLEALAPARADGNTIYYSPRESLPLIYGRDAAAGGDGKEYLDLSQERAKLARLQAEKAKLEIEKLRGLLIPAADVETGWSQLVGAFRSRILVMATKLAPLLAAETDVKATQKILQKECKEALSELSRFSPSSPDRPDDSERGEPGGSASGSDGRRMG